MLLSAGGQVLALPMVTWGAPHGHWPLSQYPFVLSPFELKIVHWLSRIMQITCVVFGGLGTRQAHIPHQPNRNTTEGTPQIWVFANLVPETNCQLQRTQYGKTEVKDLFYFKFYFNW
jgi:hypothetical protein